MRFQHHTNKNPKPLIIKTQGHNNKKFGKMNLYEAFQQALSVPLKGEQNWYRSSTENVEIEGSSSQMVMMMRERERRGKKKKKKQGYGQK